MLLRPNGSFLSTSKGRFLVGKEMLVLMGIPIHRYDTSMLSSRDALQKFRWWFWMFNQSDLNGFI